LEEAVWGDCGYSDLGPLWCVDPHCGEIFLDKMPADSKMFLSLTLEGNPSNLGFQLSGLVGGQPLAAVPNRVLDWSD
jgi:hypothetical protein